MEEERSRMSERENIPTFTISPPVPGDEVAVGPMQVQAWHEAYLHPELGVTDDVIQDAIKFVATTDGNEFRKNLFAEVQSDPSRVLYRVVKDSKGDIVGFMHGTKHNQSNELGGIYLLDVVKGKSVGNRLMEEFLAWCDPAKPTTLQVIAFNDRALSFYQKYGFEKTKNKLEPFEKKFPLVEMIKSVK